MKKSRRSKQLRQCSQCRQSFTVQTASPEQTLCPICAAFDDIVEEAITEQKEEKSDTRWSWFQTKKKEATPTPTQITTEEQQHTTTTSQAFPTCQHCGGPLLSIPTFRSKAARWIKESIHISIGLAAFYVKPPYGIGFGILYMSLTLWLERRRPLPRYWKCQHCGKKS